jgi:hypothetical protein
MKFQIAETYMYIFYNSVVVVVINAQALGRIPFAF